MKNIKKILGVFVIMACALLILPNNVSAEEMSAEFKSLLTDSGKLRVNGFKPSSIEETYFLFEALYMSDEDNYLNYYWDNFSDDFSTVDFTINAGESNEETHTVGIEYVYDKDIKAMVDGYLSKIPETLEFFNVSDMEVINFWVNGKGDEANLINYSSELKKYLDYKNFNIDLRLGDSEKLITYTSGIANFIHNNTIYGMRDQTGVLAKHVIYVDENTANTKEALISAVQAKIDNYIGKDKVKVTFGGEGAYNLYAKVYDDAIASYEAELVTIAQELEAAMQNIDNICGPVWDSYDEECMNAVNAKTAVEGRKTTVEQELSQTRSKKETFLEGYNNEDGYYYFIHDAVNDYYFKAQVGEKTYYFVIAKDNDKIVESTIKTSDVKTDVTISTSNTQIPLDTTISAEKLTSGAEYDKIVKLLNLTDNLTFDLKLYSNSLENYITKLSDGSFEVKIPISEDFEGKDLVVYYVDNDNKVTEHTVTVENGYAKFNTNHFSIYSLAVKNTTNNGNNQSGNNNQTENNNQNQGNTIVDNNQTTIKNPQTYDEIMTWIILGLISMSGIIGTIVYSKKQNI